MAWSQESVIKCFKTPHSSNSTTKKTNQIWQECGNSDHGCIQRLLKPSLSSLAFVGLWDYTFCNCGFAAITKISPETQENGATANHISDVIDRESDAPDINDLTKSEKPTDPVGLDSTSEENQGRFEVRHARWSWILFFYRLLIGLILWCTVGRMLSSFWYGGTQNIPLRILLLVWTIHNAISFTIFLKMRNGTFGYQRKFFHYWDTSLSPLLPLIGFSMPYTRFSRAQWISLLTGYILSIFNIVGVSYIIISSEEPLADVLRHIYIAPIPVNGLTKAMAVSTHTLLTFLWLLPISYYNNICYIVISAFKLFSNVIETQIKEADSIPSCFSCLRVFHARMCETVAILDSDFGWLLLNWLVTNLVLSCFSLYQLINTQMDTMLTIIIAFWFGSSIIIILIVTGYAAAVNDSAHSPLDHIFHMNVADITNEQLANLQIFIAKLNGPIIGFTALYLIPVNKEFILTLGGVFLTYFFLLYQFSLS